MKMGKQLRYGYAERGFELVRFFVKKWLNILAAINKLSYNLSEDNFLFTYVHTNPKKIGYLHPLNQG